MSESVVLASKRGFSGHDSDSSSSSDDDEFMDTQCTTSKKTKNSSSSSSSSSSDSDNGKCVKKTNKTKKSGSRSSSSSTASLSTNSTGSCQQQSPKQTVVCTVVDTASNTKSDGDKKKKKKKKSKCEDSDSEEEEDCKQNDGVLDKLKKKASKIKDDVKDTIKRVVGAQENNYTQESQAQTSNQQPLVVNAQILNSKNVLQQPHKLETDNGTEKLYTATFLLEYQGVISKLTGPLFTNLTKGNTKEEWVIIDEIRVTHVDNAFPYSLGIKFPNIQGHVRGNGNTYAYIIPQCTRGFVQDDLPVYVNDWDEHSHNSVAYSIGSYFDKDKFNRKQEINDQYLLDKDHPVVSVFNKGEHSKETKVKGFWVSKDEFEAIRERVDAIKHEPYIMDINNTLVSLERISGWKDGKELQYLSADEKRVLFDDPFKVSVTLKITYLPLSKSVKKDL